MTYDDWKLQSPHETVEVFADEAAAYFDCGVDEVTDSMLAKYAELRSDPDFWRENAC